MVALAKQSESLNRLEEAMAQLPQQPIPTMHLFTPGMYCRSVFMAKGSVFTSKIHKTEHPFVISQGMCTVVDEAGTKTILCAPHLGVTKPGTRRAILIHEDTVWSTFHATDKTDVSEMEKDIIEPHDIPAVLDGSKAQVDFFVKGASWLG